MQVDIDLYRQEVRIASAPLVRLSAIDISPDRPLRTMVFIHGYGGHATQWEYQLQHFADDSRVIALDLRGHGLSDKPNSSYSMSELVADLDAALDALGISEKIVLAGHSFGGAIVSEYAAAHPERVEKLILIAVAGEFRLAREYRLGLSLPLPVLQAAEPFFNKGRFAAPPRVLKTLHANTLATWNGWSLFRNLQVPTLVIRGHRDNLFSKAHFEEVARAIPGAEDVDVGASGHHVQLERRDAVNRAIERFLVGPRTWRETAGLAALDGTGRSGSGAAEPDDGAGRRSLLRERPWLAHYDAGVPHTLGLPRVPLHRFLRSTARRFPLQPAILYAGASLTYRRLNRESSRFANALRALGVDRGGRVLLYLPNLPQAVIAYYGVLKAGGVVVWSPPNSGAEELARQIRDVGATVLVTLTRHAEAAREAARQTSLPHLIFTSAADYLPWLQQAKLSLDRTAGAAHRLPFPLEPGMHLWSRMLWAYPPRSPEVEVGPDDLAAIHYTGGTTGEPRGVMLSHRNLVANMLQTRHWIPGLREGGEAILAALPFSHSYGTTLGLNLAVALGAALVLLPRFPGPPTSEAFDNSKMAGAGEAGDVLRAIRRYRPTLFPGVPSMYIAINNYPEVRSYGVDSIKACISGSAPLPVEVQEAFEKLTRGRLVEGYGLTEASPVTHGNPLLGRRKVGSIGVPLPSTEARILDLATGLDAPAGQIGELAVRGPQVMAGYWDERPASRRLSADTAPSRALTADGWLLTGDVAWMDEDGYFQIVARRAEMWYPERDGRQPAFPRDVEEALFEVPQVREAVVVAVANQPIAFVIAAGSPGDRPTADSLIAYCKRRLPPEIVPRAVVFVDDFPRTFIGKVLRRELAKRYEERSRETAPASGLAEVTRAPGLGESLQ